MSPAGLPTVLLPTARPALLLRTKKPATRLFTFHSIQDYHKALRDGTASCEEAVLSYLTAIEQQAALNAYTQVYGDEALARARELDRERQSGKPMGSLHGVVIGLKDVI